MGRIFRAAALSGLVFALAAFLWANCADPVWEARVTLALDSPDALTALPGILAGEGASAYAIPGTDVMEVAIRAASPELAQSRLGESLSRIPENLRYLEIQAEVSTLATAARCLSRPRPGLYALVGGILGALAAILWLIPAPKAREPMDLGDFLFALAGTAQKRVAPIFLTVILLAGGNALRIQLTSVPQYPAQALIRVGEYDPATADGLAGAVLGLVNSQLGDPSVDANRVGKTNLFRLHTVSGSKEVALSQLDNFLTRLPRLLAHISTAPDHVILEPPSVDRPETPSPLRGAILGAGIGLSLWLVVLTGQVLRREEGLYSRG